MDRDPCSLFQVAVVESILLVSMETDVVGTPAGSRATDALWFVMTDLRLSVCVNLNKYINLIDLYSA